ncbi:hypothetical protein [Parasitella parasitica]|uniref:MULE transposase domain-containing protein n=1 Tax=Parasitella parasitica TaxID=35722 RepID=A0A0B7NAY8_9FUNG|nr:hypothetical protein [Parasitella parasitica]
MSRLRRQELDGRTPVQSMIDFLATQGEYRFEIRTNDAGLNIFKTAPLTDRERAIEQVFPQASNLLCRWHISKNILTKLATSLGRGGGLTEARRNEIMRMWTSIVGDSHTEEEWTANFDHFASQPEFQLPSEDSDGNEELVGHPFIAYIKETWEGDRIKFIVTYTDNIKRFNTCNTSRVEGAHAYVKGFIESSNMDIDKVVRRMNTAINVQLEKLSAEESTGRIRVDTAIRAERIFNSVAVKLEVCSPVVNALPACTQSGYDENKISEVNAQLEEEFSNQVFAAEAREARRTLADMGRASVLFTPNVVDQVNER